MDETTKVRRHGASSERRTNVELRIRAVSARDIRFPTSLESDGTDAMHTDPNFSCAYVVIFTSGEPQGHGFTFTIGRGTEVVVQCVKALVPLLIDRSVEDIFSNFASFWRELTSESQLRWIGPEKGVVHLATAAVVNALWDLWAKIEGKPLWKLLVDMDPEELVSTIDFRYITDALTKEEAIGILEKMHSSKESRVAILKEKGYPAYTTSIGWLGYSDDKLRKLCKNALKEGFTKFKAKVGGDLDDDKKRLAIIREEIGWENLLMVDANQKWDVEQAIYWMKELIPFKPYWIEEPTSPDDILGHATIAKALNPLGIGVATGEQCQNRVMFKQFLQAKALNFCQIDSCRMGGVNEVLAVILMAAKFGVPVCPHSGGVGLCELVQHLAMWDFVAVSGTVQDRVTEYVDHLHEHFVSPVDFRKARYFPPKMAGYAEMKETSLLEYEYPHGKKWAELRAAGILN